MAKALTNCKRHPSLLIEEPINLYQDKVRHCPCCGKSTINRPYDEYDLLAQKYNTSRQTIQHVNKMRQANFPKSESLQEFIAMVLEVPPSTKFNTGYAPITISCNTCHSLFRFHYTEAGGSRVPPKHCVFCGSTSLTIHAQDLDLDYWEILATSYKMAPSTIKLFYDAFVAQNQYTHFNEFMHMLKRQLVEERQLQEQKAEAQSATN